MTSWKWSNIGDFSGQYRPHTGIREVFNNISRELGVHRPDHTIIFHISSSMSHYLRSSSCLVPLSLTMTAVLSFQLFCWNGHGVVIDKRILDLGERRPKPEAAEVRPKVTLFCYSFIDVIVRSKIRCQLDPDQRIHLSPFRKFIFNSRGRL